MLADNFHVTVKAHIEQLDKALALALQGKLPVWGFKIVRGSFVDEKDALADWHKNGPRFILFGWEDKEATPFPIPLSDQMCADIIKQWLTELAEIDYGREPNHDGDNRRGFYLTTGKFWDHIDDMGHAACLEVRPCWMMYGK